MPRWRGRRRGGEMVVRGWQMAGKREGCSCPGGTNGNSPAFQRRVPIRRPPVPKGRLRFEPRDRVLRAQSGQPSLAGLGRDGIPPSVETRRFRSAGSFFSNRSVPPPLTPALSQRERESSVALLENFNVRGPFAAIPAFNRLTVRGPFVRAWLATVERFSLSLGRGQGVRGKNPCFMPELRTILGTITLRQ